MRGDDENFLLWSIVAGSDDAICALDTCYRYTYFNDRHAAWMKAVYDADIETGKCLLDYLPQEEDRNLVQSYLGRALEGETFNAKVKVWKAVVEQSYRPVRAKDGMIMGVIVDTRDISVFKAMESGWHKALWQLNSIFDAVNDGIFMLDETGTIQDCNRAVSQLLGMPVERIVGRKCYELMHGGMDFLPGCPCQKMFVTRKRESIELAIGERWYKVITDPILKPSEEVSGAIHIISDITGEKNAEETLVKARAELEQRVAERTATLQQSMLELSDLYNHAPCGYHSLDPHGVFERINDTELSWLGYEREEMVGKLKFTDIITPENGEEFEEKFSQYMERGWARDLEFNMVRKDGSTFQVLLSATAIKDDTGNFIMSRSTVYDITRRKQLEEELRRTNEELEQRVNERTRELNSAYERLEKELVDLERAEEDLRGSEERYRLLAENSGDWIVLYDITGVILYTSPATNQLLGYLPKEIVGHKSVEYIHPEDRPLAEEKVRALYEQDDVPPVQLRFRHKDGHYVWFESIASIIYDFSSKPAQILVMNRDISERKKAEEALKVSEARYRSLIETQSDIISRSDKEGTLTFVNDAYCRVFNKTREELIGKPFMPFVLSEDLHVSLNVMKDLLQPPYRVQSETRHLTFQGVRWYSWDNAAILDERENIIEFQGIGRDITERKQAEEEILKLNDELERRVEERTAQLDAVNNDLASISYSIAHNLRAPVRALNSFSRLLVDEYNETLDKKGKNYLDRISKSSVHMGKLVDNLLNLLRVTRTEFKRSTIDLSRLAAEIIDEINVVQPSREVEWIIPPHLYVSADPGMMRVVIQHLLSNAWKFTRNSPKPQIELDRTMQNGQSVIFVRDNGAGFNMAYADKLFGIFQTLHSPGEYEGTGIGLAIVQRIILRHGGKIWAQSEIGKGATFFFTLAPDS